MTLEHSVAVECTSPDAMPNSMNETEHAVVTEHMSSDMDNSNQKPPFQQKPRVSSAFGRNPPSIR